MVPGLMELGGLPDVAGLIAPRYLLAVNGRKDTLFSEEAVEQAAATVLQIYKAAGCPERFEHRWGAEGHRFYKGKPDVAILFMEAIQSSDRKINSNRRQLASYWGFFSNTTFHGENNETDSHLFLFFWLRSISE